MSVWRTKLLTISIGKMYTRHSMHALWECEDGLFAAGNANFFILTMSTKIFEMEKLDVLS